MFDWLHAVVRILIILVLNRDTVVLDCFISSIDMISSTPDKFLVDAIHATSFFLLNLI